MTPVPGTRHPRRRRHLDWELIACGTAGHVLADPAAAPEGVDPAALVRPGGAAQWHRCLRCDSWVALPAGDAALGGVHSDPRRLALPLRGKALRDRIVLRLIAIDRLLHFLVLGGLGVGVLAFSANRVSLRDAYYRVLTSLQGGIISTHAHSGIVHDLDRLFSLQSKRLTEVGVALLAYGTLEGVEAIGLWLGKRWAEYLTFVATAILLPLEIYELTEGVSALKIVGFVINLAVVGYLLVKKRLFGLRGGGRAELAERDADGGWPAIERATPAN